MRRVKAAAATRQLLDLMTGYFACTGKIVADAGARLIKTLGDVALPPCPTITYIADDDHRPA